jgi:hypothetical protein
LRDTSLREGRLYYSGHRVDETRLAH